MTSKVLTKYFATSDPVQHSWRCIEILDGMPPLAVNGEGAIFTLEEVDDLITVD